MKQIYVTATKTAHWYGIIGHLMRWIEGVGYSHISIHFFDDFVERDVSYQANFRGVHFITTEKFLTENIVVKDWQFTIHETSFKAIYQFLWDNEDHPYGRMQIVGIALKRFLGILGIKTKNYFASGPGTQICFETVGLALAAINQCPAQEWDEMGLREFNSMLDSIEEGSYSGGSFVRNQNSDS